jgi:hypothetical protein
VKLAEQGGVGVGGRISDWSGVAPGLVGRVGLIHLYMYKQCDYNILNNTRSSQIAPPSSDPA